MQFIIKFAIFMHNDSMNRAHLMYVDWWHKIYTLSHDNVLIAKNNFNKIKLWNSRSKVIDHNKFIQTMKTLFKNNSYFIEVWCDHNNFKYL